MLVYQLLPYCSITALCCYLIKVTLFTFGKSFVQLDSTKHQKSFPRQSVSCLRWHWSYEGYPSWNQGAIKHGCGNGIVSPGNPRISLMFWSKHSTNRLHLSALQSYFVPFEKSCRRELNVELKFKASHSQVSPILLGNVELRYEAKENS